MRKAAKFLTTAVLALSTTALPALAEFPEKPVRLIVPFSAGGGTDSLARAVQAAIEKNDLLPVPLVVVNADGAAGTVGTRQVLNAEPDGYTILQIHQEMFSASAIGRVEYSPADLEPVLQASRGCLWVAVPEDSPFQTLDDLIAAAKEQGRGLKQADDIGSVTHFPAAQMMSQSGTEWTIVPTGGTSKRFAALKGGFSDFAFLSPPWIERGAEDLRGLAALGPNRFANAPDMPTAKEEGFDIEACLVRRYWAPKGTPEEVIDTLADALQAALETDAVREYVESSGEELAIVRGEELQQVVDAEYQSFLDVADMVKATSGQ